LGAKVAQNVAPGVAGGARHRKSNASCSKANWPDAEDISAIDVCSDFRILKTVRLVLVLAVAFGGGGFVVAH
jgi:hypothetical protein